MAFVFSTLTNSQNYGGILVAGGHRVPDRHFWTPEGVVTQITAEQLERLEANHVFQLHQEAGFVKIRKSEAKPEEVARDMASADSSALLDEKAFAEKLETREQEVKGRRRKR